MATRAGKHEWIAKGVCKSTWTGLLNGDDGSFLDASMLPDKTVEITGTFGAGGTVQIQDGNGHVLNDSRGEGNGATFTSADTRTLTENPQKMRPVITGGDGATSLTVVIVSESGAR